MNMRYEKNKKNSHSHADMYGFDIHVAIQIQ